MDAYSTKTKICAVPIQVCQLVYSDYFVTKCCSPAETSIPASGCHCGQASRQRHCGKKVAEAVGSVIHRHALVGDVLVVANMRDSVPPDDNLVPVKVLNFMAEASQRIHKANGVIDDKIVATALPLRVS
eukprot:362548-Chlamydomonas_euryale.AAC.12